MKSEKQIRALRKVIKYKLLNHKPIDPEKLYAMRCGYDALCWVLEEEIKWEPIRSLKGEKK